MVDAATRTAVAGHAGGRCEYCRCPSDFSSSPYAVEHFQPRDADGTDPLDNLAWACSVCNGHKATANHAHDPLTRKWVPLFHTRRQHWRRHFGWDTDGHLVLGKTATGRATIERLKVNCPSVVNLRRVLLITG